MSTHGPIRAAEAEEDSEKAMDMRHNRYQKMDEKFQRAMRNSPEGQARGY